MSSRFFGSPFDSPCPPSSSSVVELIMGNTSSTHCIVPKNSLKSDSQFVEDFFSSFLTIVLVLALLSIGAQILTKCLRYRYLREHGHGGQPSISINNNTGGGGAGAATAELTPLLPDSVIRNTTVENFLDEITREKPIRFTAQQLDGYTQRRSAELGAGGFGVVYKGMLPNGLDVAVKVLDEGKGDEVTEQQFMSELGTLWRTNHANLIRLIGYCFDDGAGVHALVYEFMPRRSLDKYLFDRKHAVGSAALLAIAAGVARGLRYLHEECQKKIIHYDVKAGNVLLDDSLTPKLTDFGIAQLLSRADAASVHAARGTFGYMAPELIHVGTAPVTEMCDVYSFGMLLFEIIGRRKNMDNGTAREESRRWLPLLAWTMYEDGKLLDLVKECHHHPMAAVDEERWRETAERMCKVAFLCVQEQPEARPTMSVVVNMLEGHLEIPPPVYPFGWMYPSSHDQEASRSDSASEPLIVIVRLDSLLVHPAAY